MDVTPYLELQIAPKAVFESLPERGSRVRFMVPTDDGDWRAVTWARFARDIRQIGLFLNNAGLKTGERAAVFAPNSVAWITAAMGIQAIGGVMVPVYPSNTASQTAYIVSHSDAKIVFVDNPVLLSRIFESWDDYADVRKIVLLSDDVDAIEVLHDLREKGQNVPSYADVEPRVVSWSRALAMGAACDQEKPELFEHLMDSVSLDQPGMMLYTSGTTGNPKGVPLTHRNVGANGRDWMQCNAPLLDEGAVDVMWLPMSHVFGFGEVCLGNTLGFTTYFSDPVQVLGKLPEVRPSVFMSIPRYWEKLAVTAMQEETPEKQAEKLREITGGHLRFCLSGGAGLKREIKEVFHASGLLIIEGYGLTEASPTLTLNRPDAFRFDSVGKPLPSVQIKLAEDGEILAKGPNIFGGYHKDPEATRETFTEDGWLKTGDIGRFTDDGFLKIVDRKKEILVTAGGKNIPPANIESQFHDDPFIAHVVVYGDGKKFISAGVWLNEQAVQAHLDKHGADATSFEEAKRAFVQERIDRANAQLAHHETIKKFNIMDEPLDIENGMLTPTLKVKRKKVYDKFRDEFEAMYG